MAEKKTITTAFLEIIDMPALKDAELGRLHSDKNVLWLQYFKAGKEYYMTVTLTEGFEIKNVHTEEIKK